MAKLMKYQGVGGGVCYACNNFRKDMNISTYEGEGGYKKHPDTADICSSCMNGGFQGNGGRSWVGISKSESEEEQTKEELSKDDLIKIIEYLIEKIKKLKKEA